MGDFNEMLDDVNVWWIWRSPITRPAGISHRSQHGRLRGFPVWRQVPDKRLRGIVTSGALTHDFANLITGVPAGQDPHGKLPNELGGGVCSVAEVVDWYGKDPNNRKTFTFGLCYAIWRVKLVLPQKAGF